MDHQLSRYPSKVTTSAAQASPPVSAPKFIRALLRETRRARVLRSIYTRYAQRTRRCNILQNRPALSSRGEVPPTQPPSAGRDRPLPHSTKVTFRLPQCEGAVATESFAPKPTACPRPHVIGVVCREVTLPRFTPAQSHTCFRHSIQGIVVGKARLALYQDLIMLIQSFGSCL